MLAGAHGSTGDTASMVAARERFLAAGRYDDIAVAVAERVRKISTEAQQRTPPPRDAAPPLLVDVAGGTGWYAAATLDAVPAMHGVTLDLSAYAARRAARAHPRLAALTADAWRPLPLDDDVAVVVLSVFGPRNPAEFRRVLAPGGRLVVVTPQPTHLEPVREALGMLTVDARKDERLATQLTGFRLESDDTVEATMRLDAPGLTDLVGMGPSAHHVDAAELADAVGRLEPPVDVRIAVRITTWSTDTPATSHTGEEVGRTGLEPVTDGL